jgi:putative phage-type endonuclease
MLNYTMRKTSHLTREQWKNLRLESIGGSEASSILGLNKYRSKYELWGIKCGMYQPMEVLNERMLCGNVLEKGIFELAKYWQNDVETTIDNYYTLESQVNKIDPANYMIYHKEHPFISANLDGIIREDATYPDRGPGVLECKTMGGWMFDQYEGGLPPYHYIQLQHYLLVTGFNWGRLFVIVDSGKVFVYDFERDEEVIAQILAAEIEFWGLVTAAKPLVGTDREHEIIEPEMDGSVAEEDFIKKQWPQSDNELIIVGTDAHYRMIRNSEDLKQAIKELEEKSRVITNNIKKFMGEAAILDFGDRGKVSYKTNIKGVRSFHVNIK